MLRNTRLGYGWVAIALHWTIAVLIVGQWTLGKMMKSIADQRLSFDLIQWHKSFGLLILALAFFRLVWRLANPRPALPAETSGLERQAAGWTHRALYALMIVMPLTGWAIASTTVLEIPTLAFYLFIVPDLPLTRSDAAEALWASVHDVLGWVLLGLVLLHVLAALRHHFLLHDGVLVRMLGAGPPVNRE
ncbi:MAG: cytochrome b [Rhizobiales bacterium 65-79]|jgi:cytochrome b561|nr:cytochrome b [Hyphomicrobiales bacterium]OJU05701.1 MAG: cytochrome b [Rhizobiales bacterium 65-79]